MNDAVLAAMVQPYPPGFRAPRWLALAEATAVVELGARAAWPVRRLAERWGWGKTQAAVIVAECGGSAAAEGVKTATGHGPDTDRTTIGHAKASDRAKSAADRTPTGHGPDNAGQGQTETAHAEVSDRTTIGHAKASDRAKSAADRTPTGQASRACARARAEEIGDLENRSPPTPPGGGGDSWPGRAARRPRVSAAKRRDLALREHWAQRRAEVEADGAGVGQVGADDELGSRARAALSGRLPANVWEVWFSPVAFTSPSPGLLVVEVPQRHTRGWLFDNYGGALAELAEAVLGEGATVEIRVAGESEGLQVLEER